MYLSVYLRCGHRGVPAPVRTHWIGLDGQLDHPSSYIRWSPRASRECEDFGIITELSSGTYHFSRNYVSKMAYYVSSDIAHDVSRQNVFPDTGFCWSSLQTNRVPTRTKELSVNVTILVSLHNITNSS